MIFRQLTGSVTQSVVCWVLLSDPRLSDCIALCIPAHGQISQFSERGVAINGVVKADEHGTAFEHAVPKKLPRTITSVM